MTPSLPDRDVIRSKLRVIEESLDVLDAAGDVTGDRLRGDPIMRLLSSALDAKGYTTSSTPIPAVRTTTPQGAVIEMVEAGFDLDVARVIGLTRRTSWRPCTTTARS